MPIVCFKMPKRRDFGHPNRNRTADRPPAFASAPQKGLDFQRGFSRLLVDLLHQRFDAVIREKVPEQISRLVERINEARERTPTAREQRPQGKATMQKPSFVYCPFCLGTGQRSGRNTAQQPVSVCPECKGRGFLESTPDPANPLMRAAVA